MAAGKGGGHHLRGGVESGADGLRRGAQDESHLLGGEVSVEAEQDHRPEAGAEGAQRLFHIARPPVLCRLQPPAGPTIRWCICLVQIDGTAAWGWHERQEAAHGD